jgi:hypothetical protein
VMNLSETQPDCNPIIAAWARGCDDAWAYEPIAKPMSFGKSDEMSTLIRETFKTSRLAEFCSQKELVNQTGKTVQSRLGHSTLAMTADTYGHLFPRGDDREKLEAGQRGLLG